MPDSVRAVSIAEAKGFDDVAATRPDHLEITAYTFISLHPFENHHEKLRQGGRRGGEAVNGKADCDSVLPPLSPSRLNSYGRLNRIDDFRPTFARSTIPAIAAEVSGHTYGRFITRRRFASCKCRRHYNGFAGGTDRERADLIEYLKSL